MYLLGKRFLLHYTRRSSGIDGRFGFCSLGLGQCCETRISGRHGLDSMILAPTAQFRTASMNFRSYSTERSKLSQP